MIVTSEAIAYGTIEHFSTDLCLGPSTLSPVSSPLIALLHRTDYADFPDALVSGLSTLSKLYRQCLFLQALHDYLKPCAAEYSINEDNVYFTNILAASTTNITATTNQYTEAKSLFEVAKSNFVTDFCTFHQGKSFRRCKVVRHCQTSKLLLQIEGNTSTHHSNDFKDANFASVIFSHPILPQTLKLNHTIPTLRNITRRTRCNNSCSSY